MAKKQKEKTLEGGTLPQVNIVEERTMQGVKYLDRISPEMLNNPDYIPDHIQTVLDSTVREDRKEFDFLTELMENSDKASDEYGAAARSREQIARRWVTMKNQIEEYKNSTRGLKTALASMSEGTDEKNLYTNMLVFGAQSDAIDFDKDGRMSFASVYGEGKNDISIFKLDDMLSTETGESPIIVEPVGTKAFVWKMANKTKEDSDAGKPFDENWTYTEIYSDLTERGTNNTIGAAHADLAGDNQSKSFAKMYEEGLKDQSYYIHPETGEVMPSDSSWMKNPKNVDILKKFLGKYITSIMKDVHGPVIDEETGLIKKSQAEIAQEIVKKYRK